MAIRGVMLSGETVRTLRRKRWTSRVGFAAVCGISPRVLADIERNKRAVSIGVANKLARALGTSMASIKTHDVYSPGLAYLELSHIPAKYRSELSRARECDMADNHQDAIFICNRILRALRQGTPDARATISILLATFLDNAGQHNTALKRLGGQKQLWLQQLPNHLAHWVRYHRAIAHRRMGQLAEAEQELQPLLADTAAEHWPAAQHQLGVILQERSQGTDTTLLEQALTHFRASQQIWHREHNHREGFSLRRIAQIYAQQQDFPQSIRYFVDSISVFTRCRCHRYVNDARKDLEEYVLTELSAK